MLYNQYRSRDYSEVCGQEDSLITLRKQAVTGKFGQAYLLAGYHGTGKTTVGRILARAVNCLEPSEKGPCNHCANCLTARNSLDIIELDAASNNGVDKIKELVSKTKYKPISLPKKVYLIDEVHNLSPSAFDALLKTIEEPPSYCVFILCTTELQKIPVTIVSRCEQYSFHKIEPGIMKQRLKYVLQDQKAECEEGALNLIVRRADGALRDALSILEQLLACADGKITTEAAKKSLGIMGEELVIQILDTILGHKTLDALKMYDELLKNGKAPGLLADNFLETLTDLVTLMSTDSPESIYHSPEYVSSLMEMAGHANLERVFWLTDQFCDLRAAVRDSVTPSMDIRLCIIKTSNKELIMSDPASMASELAVQRIEIIRLKELISRLQAGAELGTVRVPLPADAVGKGIEEHEGTIKEMEELGPHEQPAADLKSGKPDLPADMESQVMPQDPQPSKTGTEKGENEAGKVTELREKLPKQEGGMQSGGNQREHDGKGGKKGFTLSVKDVFKMLS